MRKCSNVTLSLFFWKTPQSTLALRWSDEVCTRVRQTAAQRFCRNTLCRALGRPSSTGSGPPSVGRPPYLQHKRRWWAQTELLLSFWVMTTVRSCGSHRKQKLRFLFAGGMSSPSLERGAVLRSPGGSASAGLVSTSSAQQPGQRLPGQRAQAPSQLEHKKHHLAEPHDYCNQTGGLTELHFFISLNTNTTYTLTDSDLKSGFPSNKHFFFLFKNVHKKAQQFLLGGGGGC